MRPLGVVSAKEPMLGSELGLLLGKKKALLVKRLVLGCLCAREWNVLECWEGAPCSTRSPKKGSTEFSLLQKVALLRDERKWVADCTYDVKF